MIFKTLRPIQPLTTIGAVVLSKQFFTLQESENERLRQTWRGLVIAISSKLECGNLFHL